MESKAWTFLSHKERWSLALVFGAGVLIWSALAFGVAGLFAQSSAAYGIVPPPISYLYVTDTPTALLPTWTPTALPTPTPTLLPSPTLPPTPTPTPTLTPHPGQPLMVSEDVMVVALLGLDNPRNSMLWRTDSIHLVFINERSKDIAILGIPRDLWVTIPGYPSNRINTVDSLGQRKRHPGGGPALLDETLRHNLGVPVHHYVRIDFQGFIRIIDAMGGVTVDVKRPIRDPIYTGLDIDAGIHHLDGQTTLSYCRSRFTTSDFDRSRRQQQVMVALWKKALTPQTLLQAPKLWAEFRDMFQTDLTMAEVVRLAYLAQSIGAENVHTASLDLGTTRPWTTPAGAQVLLPRTKEIQRVIFDLLGPSGVQGN